MQTFSNDTKQVIVNIQYGYCATTGCNNKIHSIHHCLPNTKWNRKKFPLFCSSPMNAKGLCEYCHTNVPHLFRITEDTAMVYEEYMQSLIDIAKREKESPSMEHIT